MPKFLEKIKKILPDSCDDQNTRFFKIMIYVTTGLLFFMILSGSIAFMIVLKGAEEVMVPDVIGMKLEDALISAQERGLNSRIQLKNSSNPADKGNVIEQDPHPGTIRKAGSQIILRVSKGAVIDKIENYVGWNLNDLEAHLRTLFNTFGPLLKIGEPVMRVYSDKPEGTILEQKPLPGTDLSGLTELQLVVSRGPEGKTFAVPDFSGLDYMQAMKMAAGRNLSFLFTQREGKSNEGRGVVVSQKPQSGEFVPAGTIMQFTITPPARSGERVFGILERVLPEYPVHVEMKFESISPDGAREEFLRMKHRGGAIAFPYFFEEGTSILITALGEELVFFTVKK